jgi:HNH endonuclease
MGKKDDPDFMALLTKHGSLDEATGDVRFEGMYASVLISIGWNGTVVTVPQSHVVWFLTRGRWPAEGMQIDHIDDDPMNNAPSNLAEVTHAENQFKRRGRIVSRAYGSGKYGYGLNLTQDNRDGRYYVTRFLSRGHHGVSKTVRKGIGGFDTKAEAESAIAKCIAGIKEHGDNYVPEASKNEKKASIALMVATKQMRMLRAHGLTYDKIASMLGFSTASVHMRTKDVIIGDLNEIAGVDERRGKYRARVRLDGKDIHVGDFDTIGLAIAAHKDAILKHYEASP